MKIGWHSLLQAVCRRHWKQGVDATVRISVDLPLIADLGFPMLRTQLEASCATTELVRMAVEME
jgi:hypothetical protein